MYSSHFDPGSIQTACNISLSVTSNEVERVLKKKHKSWDDLAILLSPKALFFLEEMASQAHTLTCQRFGKTMQLFAPLYLSNFCYNSCHYCGFSMENKTPRITLTQAQRIQEATFLNKRGFQHVLLLTGEAEKESIAMIAESIVDMRPFFASIGIEVQPLDTADYIYLIEKGADSLTVYQETYHLDTYATYHTRGRKKNFTYRLDTPDRGAMAGFYRINIGALMGLYDWRYDSLALGHHLAYLQKKYWKTHYSVSFPRIQEMTGNFIPQYLFSDQELAQVIVAFRLVFPDVGISLSTRETPFLRDHLIKLGVTSLSAESKTNPGGYSIYTDAEAQFSTSDHRSLAEIKAFLYLNGIEPMMKNHA